MSSLPSSPIWSRGDLTTSEFRRYPAVRAAGSTSPLHSSPLYRNRRRDPTTNPASSLPATPNHRPLQSHYRSNPASSLPATPNHSSLQPNYRSDPASSILGTLPAHCPPQPHYRSTALLSQAPNSTPSLVRQRSLPSTPPATTMAVPLTTL